MPSRGGLYVHVGGSTLEELDGTRGTRRRTTGLHHRDPLVGVAGEVEQRGLRDVSRDGLRHVRHLNKALLSGEGRSPLTLSEERLPISKASRSTMASVCRLSWVIRQTVLSRMTPCSSTRKSYLDWPTWREGGVIEVDASESVSSPLEDI